MTVDYILPGGSWTAATKLFDNSAGDANEKFAPTFKDQVYQTPGYGQDNNIKIPLGNTQANAPFAWNSVYTSYAAALAAVATLRASLKGKRIHLRITEGATVLYLPNAVLENYAADVHGATVDHSMNFTADDLTSTAP
jgi:hypothetical protein